MSIIGAKMSNFGTVFVQHTEINTFLIMRSNYVAFCRDFHPETYTGRGVYAASEVSALPLQLETIEPAELFIWFLKCKKRVTQATYSALMFFKLNFLIILCRLKKDDFLRYIFDNKDNTARMPFKDLYTQVMFFVGIAVILVFFAFGIFILVSPVLDYVPKTFRLGLAIFILLYGCIRSLQVVQKIRKSKEDRL